MIYTVVVTDDSNNLAGTIMVQHPTWDTEVVSKIFKQELENLFEELHKEEG